MGLQDANIHKILNVSAFVINRHCNQSQVLVKMTRSDGQWLSPIGWVDSEKGTLLECRPHGDKTEIDIPERFTRDLQDGDVLTLSCIEMDFQGTLIWSDPAGGGLPPLAKPFFNEDGARASESERQSNSTRKFLSRLGQRFKRPSGASESENSSSQTADKAVGEEAQTAASEDLTNNLGTAPLDEMTQTERHALEARQAAEMIRAEMEQAQATKQAADQRAEEAARLAEDARQAEEERIAALNRAAKALEKAEKARAAEVRRLEEARRQEEARLAEEARIKEEARLAEIARKLEAQRQAARADLKAELKSVVAARKETRAQFKQLKSVFGDLDNQRSTHTEKLSEIETTLRTSRENMAEEKMALGLKNQSAEDIRSQITAIDVQADHARQKDESFAVEIYQAEKTFKQAQDEAKAAQDRADTLKLTWTNLQQTRLAEQDAIAHMAEDRQRLDKMVTKADRAISRAEKELFKSTDALKNLEIKHEEMRQADHAIAHELRIAQVDLETSRIKLEDLSAREAATTSALAQLDTDMSVEEIKSNLSASLLTGSNLGDLDNSPQDTPKAPKAPKDRGQLDGVNSDISDTVVADEDVFVTEDAICTNLNKDREKGLHPASEPELEVELASKKKTLVSKKDAVVANPLLVNHTSDILYADAEIKTDDTLGKNFADKITTGIKSKTFLTGAILSALVLGGYGVYTVMTAWKTPETINSKALSSQSVTPVKVIDPVEVIEPVKINGVLPTGAVGQDKAPLETAASEVPMISQTRNGVETASPGTELSEPAALTPDSIATPQVVVAVVNNEFINPAFQYSSPEFLAKASLGVNVSPLLDPIAIGSSAIEPSVKSVSILGPIADKKTATQGAVTKTRPQPVAAKTVSVKPRGPKTTGHVNSREQAPNQARNYTKVNLDVQTKLQDLGFYDGPLDGRLNRQTLSAMQNFQTLFDIPKSRVITVSFLNALNGAGTQSVSVVPPLDTSSTTAASDTLAVINPVTIAVQEAPATTISTTSSQTVSSELADTSGTATSLAETAITETPETETPVAERRVAEAALSPDVLIADPLTSTPDLGAQEIIAPIKIAGVGARYPSLALRRKVFENVDVEITYDIGLEGEIINPVVTRNSYEGRFKQHFEREALKSVSKSKFQPRTINGQAVMTKDFVSRVKFRVE